MENLIEKWKPAKYIYPDGSLIDFSDYYEVSNTGRVKHLERVRIKQGVKQTYKEKITDYSHYKSRYCDTHFTKDGVKYKIQIHRLVLSTFIPVSDTYECCNHKDENTHNNRLENLEWCDYSYNSTYNNRSVKIGKKLNGVYNKTGGCKITQQFDLDGNLIKEWPSASEAARHLNINKSNIICCCLGHHKTAYGYIWKYK